MKKDKYTLIFLLVIFGALSIIYLLDFRGYDKGFKRGYLYGYERGEHRGLLMAAEVAKRTDKWTEHLYVTGEYCNLNDLLIIVVPEPAAGIIIKNTTNVSAVNNVIMYK